MALSGRGTVWFVCEFHRPYLRRFAAELPYVEITIEMRLEAVFEPVAPDVALVEFRPVPEASS